MSSTDADGDVDDACKTMPAQQLPALPLAGSGTDRRSHELPPLPTASAEVRSARPCNPPAVTVAAASCRCGSVTFWPSRVPPHDIVGRIDDAVVVVVADRRGTGGAISVPTDVRAARPRRAR